MKRILFVNQDMMPYVAETELSSMGKLIPQKVQESGFEIRSFMPRWGNINERRGQLHEVIRLSGLNIPINDTDHPLIIKVASIPQTKMQVYFIDNDEFFSRKGQTKDTDGKLYADNGERASFFARGVIETIKKLRWVPDVIVCQGWMTELLPMIIKIGYKDEPAVCNAKVVTALYSERPDSSLQSDTKDCLCYNDITTEYLSKYNDNIDSSVLAKIAIDHSDGVIIASPSVNETLMEYAKEACPNCMTYTTDNSINQIIEFLEKL